MAYTSFTQIVIFLSILILALKTSYGLAWITTDHFPVSQSHRIGLGIELPTDTGHDLDPDTEGIVDMSHMDHSYPRLDIRPRFDEIRRPKARCDRRIRVVNGATRVRDRGSLVRFQCAYGFQ